MTQGQKRMLGLAVASLVCGCLVFIPAVGVLFAIAALVMGIMAYARISRHDSGLKGEGLAIAGIVLGAVGLVVGFILLMLMLIAIPGLMRARSVANEQTAESHMESLGIALEQYAVTQGHYPASEEALIEEVAPFLDEPYDGRTIIGYTYSVALGPDAYSVVAVPAKCGTTGDTIFRLTEGAALQKERCVSAIE